MKRAGTDVPILRRWFAGPVYQFGEAATKFHIKEFFNIVGVHTLIMCQRIELVFQYFLFIRFRHLLPILSPIG